MFSDMAIGFGFYESATVSLDKPLSAMDVSGGHHPGEWWPPYVSAASFGEGMGMGQRANVTQLDELVSGQVRKRALMQVHAKQILRALQSPRRRAPVVPVESRES